MGPLGLPQEFLSRERQYTHRRRPLRLTARFGRLSSRGIVLTKESKIEGITG